MVKLGGHLYPNLHRTGQAPDKKSKIVLAHALREVAGRDAAVGFLFVLVVALANRGPRRREGIGPGGGTCPSSSARLPPGRSPGRGLPGVLPLLPPQPAPVVHLGGLPASRGGASSERGAALRPLASRGAPLAGLGCTVPPAVG